MLLQGYDFCELYRKYGCRAQIAGSDQWGNITSGTELGRRKYDVELFGFTSPIITDSAGRKMGKSEGNAVWINEDKLPAYDYYQYFRNIGDAEVGKCLRIYTDLPMDEIRRLEDLKDQEINEAKKILPLRQQKSAAVLTKQKRPKKRRSKLLNRAASAANCRPWKKTTSPACRFSTPLSKSASAPAKAKCGG